MSLQFCLFGVFLNDVTLFVTCFEKKRPLVYQFENNRQSKIQNCQQNRKKLKINGTAKTSKLLRPKNISQNNAAPWHEPDVFTCYDLQQKTFE